ncbi:MAG: penicillin-binding protein 2 [Epulopiscium sp.]|nr:penicillin-binding protein 2 [Candidatus Epulonipiscium sp.]
MKQVKKDIKKIFWLYSLMFCALIGYLLKFIFLDSPIVIINPYNPRLNSLEKSILRGEIRDNKGVVLARTKMDKDGWMREYPQGRDFAHVVGSVQKGKTGIEAYANFMLLEVNDKMVQRVKEVFTGDKLKGNHVVLTLDANLQRTSRELLKGKKGAILVMEPSTGKILSMVSNPDFNPNELSQNWEQLNKDEENSPLINRATQGLYPPGSIFKVITAASALESEKGLEGFLYNCKGEDIFDGNLIRCYNSKPHGEVDLNKAFYVSCNTAFAKLGTDVGGERLKQTSERLLFNRPLPYELDYNRSQFVLTKHSEDKEIVETAMGQGRTLVSPLHMGMITSAIANGGILMKPYIIDHMETNYGKTKNKKIPEKFAVLFDAGDANRLTNMMVDVVNKGTGTKAQISNISVAGKTGTAQNASGEDHAWFIGFAPSQKPEAVVVVIIENGGSGGSSAGPIARKLLQQVLNN